MLAGRRPFCTSHSSLPEQVAFKIVPSKYAIPGPNPTWQVVVAVLLFIFAAGTSFQIGLAANVSRLPEVRNGLTCLSVASMLHDSSQSLLLQQACMQLAWAHTAVQDSRYRKQQVCTHLQCARAAAVTCYAPREASSTAS